MLRRPRQAITRLRHQPETPQRTSGRKRQRGTPPDSVGKGPLLSSPGLRLGIVVIVRDEAPYLEEWLAYHRALGVDHVFLYDNGSRDALHEVVEGWVNHGLLTLLHWPLPGGQLDAYAHAVRFFGPSVDWLAFIDVDEFIVPLVDDDIPTLLARWPNAADVRIPRVDFGFSGHRSPPVGLTVEAYTGVADVFGRDPSKPPRVKTVLRPGSVTAVGIHTATTADLPLDAEGRPVPHDTVGAACHPYVQLNHYYTRSFEEFEAKRFRGSATGRIARPAVPFDLPTIETSTVAARFAERTRAELARLHSLEARPYTYGSQLHLEWFPRPNDLGRFAEFALANLAAGLAEPARSAALRLRNLHEGIGLVADLAAVGYQPALAGLSASVHLDVLVEHMRGRLDGSLVSEGAEVLALEARAGTAELGLALPQHTMARCWSAGFIVGSAAALSLELAVEHQDGTWSEPVRLALPASPAIAGVVEVEPVPSHAARLRVRVDGAAGRLDVYDLFAISTG
jgi:hypothetical protein